MPDLTAALPSTLRAASRWQQLGNVPVMLSHPDPSAGPAPVVLWMHGRTVQKEIDPGRYLRWLRAGIGACAIDLPGHGERFDASLQDPYRTLEVVLQMADEIDGILEQLAALGTYDMTRVGIGGMSAGGMATLVRLCREHPFSCVSVEATSGSWSHQRQREMFAERTDEEVAARDPIRNLDRWRPIPFQAFHSRLDEWVDFNGQQAFVEALRSRSTEPDQVQFVVFEETGAPFEHAGFGRHAAAAKNDQQTFFARYLKG